jgi:hypothetical protein
MGQYLSLSFFDVYVGDNLKFVWAELSIWKLSSFVSL